MRHGRAARRLSEYLDGTLAVRSASGVEAHLLQCAECRSELGELQRVRSLLRELRGVEDAPDLSVAVLARVEQGDADASALERLRWNVGRLFGAPWSAPLATLATGLLLLAFVPPLQIEVSIPSRTEPAALQPLARAAGQSPAAPLASRRVAETVLPPGADLPQRLPAVATHRRPAASFDCWEQPSFDACQEQHHVLMDLAMRDPHAFLAQLDAVPGTARERWLRGLSRFAAEAGSATLVAERLRASDDPRAWQVANRFESAGFDGR
jgi:hypothetical protein